MRANNVASRGIFFLKGLFACSRMLQRSPAIAPIYFECVRYRDGSSENSIFISAETLLTLSFTSPTSMQSKCRARVIYTYFGWEESVSQLTVINLTRLCSILCMDALINKVKALKFPSQVNSSSERKHVRPFFLAAASSPTRGDHLGEPFVSAISRATAEQFKLFTWRIMSCERTNGRCKKQINYIKRCIFKFHQKILKDLYTFDFILCLYVDFEPQCHVFRTKQLRKPRPCHLCHQAVIKQASCCRGKSITSFPSGQ
ncbi:hypothetical protein ALC57_18648 [Trachymyrmex cornetzi]|uniref:Uncharacterized protein n=1 Tax=Trachymyrmex cornetzi TaxID=471704 RepID=A0A195D8K8_9HYME|nr:hypothetical protein ALC57_18648 [Trachymyrmex cornetzi]